MAGWNQQRVAREDRGQSESMRLPQDVAVVYVYLARDGARYTCRDSNRRVVYDSTRAFRSRRQATDEVRRYWPNAKVTYER